MTAVSAALMPALAGASPWAPDPGIQLADKGYVTQKVELVDLNNDGFVDVVFANSSGDNTGNDQNAQLNQIFINDAGAGFTELDGVFEAKDNAYTIKSGDLDNDGDADLVVGINFTGTSYVLINEGNNTFTPSTIAPSANRSIGDLELGDVDRDGNLDIVATDWGSSQPYGDPVDQGAPVQLWLGNGDGTFSDANANLPMGMENLSAWSFDLELADIDNDYDLDVLVSNRGVGWALVFKNDGDGAFSTFEVPALKSNIAKQVNASFTPMDFDGDGSLDVITLQDGIGQGGNCVDIMGVQYCAKRNSILINDGAGQFEDNPGGLWWANQYNPAKLDFDVATLDFDSDGRPDFVTTGPRLGPNDKNSRLFLNGGAAFAPAPVPMDSAFPLVPELAQTFGVMFADFNHDRREDAAVAQRDAALPNYVLFGRADPADGIAEDTSPPRIYDDNFGDKLPKLLKFGDSAGFMARVDDHKTPTRWHDFLYDTALDDLNLVGDGAGLLAHGRRLPYMEFAFGLANPDDLKALADNDPKKYIAPSIWMGESLWRVSFNVPFSGKIPDTLTWQYCAIDAANNKTCVGPYQIMVEGTCGDGMVQDWEECDDNTATCVDCVQTCGDGVCDPNETPENCPEDCLCGNGICDPGETFMTCPEDCPEDPCDNDDMCEPNQGENSNNCDDCVSECGDGTCDPGEVCPQDCDDPTTGGCVCGDGVCDPACGEDVNSCAADCAECGDGICSPGEVCDKDCVSTSGECPDTAGVGDDGQCQLDDDGCGCVADPEDSRGLWASLLLLGVFGVRRSRRRA